MGIDCGATCSAVFQRYGQVTLSVTPDPGSVFEGWSGDCQATTGDCLVTMNGDRTATATFNASAYTVTVNRMGSGSASGLVTSMPAGLDCGGVCSAPFNVGATVTLSAASDGTATFLGWGGDCAATAAPTCSLTMDASKTVDATFSRVTHTLAVTLAGGGGGSINSSPPGVNCPGTACSASFDVGTVVTLTPTPDASSIFRGWSGAGCAGTGPCVATMDLDRAVTATFAPPGEFLWAERFGGVSAEQGTAVAFDGAGDIVLTGWFSADVNFGGVPLTSAGSSDIFLATYSGADGSHIRSRRFGSTSSDEGIALAVGTSGNTFLGGSFGATVNFGGGTLISAGGADGFVASYSGVDGTYLWSARYGAAITDKVTSIAVDSTGAILVAGFFDGSVDFGGGALASVGNTDIFVAKYAADGSHIWSRRFGGSTTTGPAGWPWTPRGACS